MVVNGTMRSYVILVLVLVGDMNVGGVYSEFSATFIGFSMRLTPDDFRNMCLKVIDSYNFWETLVLCSVNYLVNINFVLQINEVPRLKVLHIEICVNLIELVFLKKKYFRV